MAWYTVIASHGLFMLHGGCAMQWKASGPLWTAVNFNDLLPSAVLAELTPQLPTHERGCSGNFVATAFHVFIVSQKYNYFYFYQKVT